MHACKIIAVFGCCFLFAENLFTSLMQTLMQNTWVREMCHSSHECLLQGLLQESNACCIIFDHSCRVTSQFNAVLFFFPAHLSVLTRLNAAGDAQAPETPESSRPPSCGPAEGAAPARNLLIMLVSSTSPHWTKVRNNFPNSHLVWSTSVKVALGLSFRLRFKQTNGARILRPYLSKSATTLMEVILSISDTQVCFDMMCFI